MPNKNDIRYFFKPQKNKGNKLLLSGKNFLSDKN